MTTLQEEMGKEDLLKLLLDPSLAQLSSDEQTNKQNAKRLYDIFCAYWSRKVPQIYEPESASLSQVFNEELASQELFGLLDVFITQSLKPDEVYSKLAENVSGKDHCGRVFKHGEPTYSCRECATDPTCVLCVDCFQNSVHRNHSYRIGAGSGSGFCDCGDEEAWKMEPSCVLHAKRQSGGSAANPTHNNPAVADLLRRGHFVLAMVTDFAYCMLKYAEGELPNELKPPNYPEEDRKYVAVLFNDETHTYENVIHALTKSLGCSNKMATDIATVVDRKGRCIIYLGKRDRCEHIAHEIGVVTRRNHEKRLEVRVLCSYLLAHQTFASRLLRWVKQSLLSKSSDLFCFELAKHLFAPDHKIPMIDFEESFNALPHDDHLSLLEKLFRSDTCFWKSIRVQWHKLMMATLLIDVTFKQQMARLFVRNIEPMLLDYMKDDHEQKDSVMCLSVQLFTVPSVAIMLVQEENVVEKLINIFLDVNLRLHRDKIFKFELGVSINEMSMKFRRSYEVLGHLNYIISNKPLEWTPELRQTYHRGVVAFVKLLKRMQLMDSVVRQLDQHVEFEPNWELGINLQSRLLCITKSFAEWSEDDRECYMMVLNTVMRFHRKQFDYHNRNLQPVLKHVAGHSAFVLDYDVSVKEVSLHFPLTRFVATLLLPLHMMGFSYNDSQELVEKIAPETLIEYPFRAQVLVGQFRAGMWRRNGYALVNQISFYNNVRLRSEMFERDILALQIGASLMNPNEFMIHMLNKYNLLFLADDQCERNLPTAMKQDDLLRQMISIIDEFFRLFYILLVERWRVNLGAVTEDETVRHETIQWLCRESMTHSDLINHLTFNDETKLEGIFAQVADFCKPSNKTCGKYVLKQEMREEFNPFYYHYTRQQHSQSLEQQLRLKRQNKERYICCPPPMLPPFCKQFEPINQLLMCDVTMAIIKNVLLNAANLNSLYFTDSQFQMALYLIGIGLNEEIRIADASFRFTAKCADNNIVPLLEKINESRHILARIEPHTDLLKWTFDRFKEAMQLAYANEPAHKQPKGAVPMETSSQAQESELLEEKAKQRKAQAEALKKRILAQMAKKQSDFIKDNTEYFEAAHDKKKKDSSSSSMEVCEDVTTSETIPVAFGVKQTAAYPPPEMAQFTCILCHELHDTKAPERYLLQAGYIQKSTVLSKNRKRRDWEAKCSTVFVPSDHNYGPFINTCTHYMHHDCFDKYLEMVGLNDRRRMGRQGRNASFDINRGEFLCPLCECLCNLTIPVMAPRAPIKPGSLVVDMPIDQWLSGLHSLVDSIQIWTDDASKFNGTNSRFFDPFANLAREMPADVGKVYTDLRKEYEVNMQPQISEADEHPEMQIHRTRTYVIMSFSESLYSRLYDNKSLLRKEYFDWDIKNETIFWSIAYSIEVLERQLRCDMLSLNDLIQSRPYHCLRHLISLSRWLMINNSLSVNKNASYMRLIFFRLTNYLLVGNVYISSPITVLELNAFVTLVNLLSTSAAFFHNYDLPPQHTSFVSSSRGAFDKNLVELMLMFHIVQIFLTNPDMFDVGEMEDGAEAMDVEEGDKSDDATTTASTSTTKPQASTDDGEQDGVAIAKFYVDLFTAARLLLTPKRALKSGSQRQALTCKVKEALLPFLRSTALFAYFDTDVPMPPQLMGKPGTPALKVSVPEEYRLLSTYLGISTRINTLLETVQLRDLALLWARHPKLSSCFISVGNGDERVSRISPTHDSLRQPHTVNQLVELPKEYTTLINSVAHFTCPTSRGDECRYPTMCLICGKIVCAQNYCCQQLDSDEPIGAANYHARQCGAGTSIFLRIRDCKIMLLTTEGRGCYLQPPYVDKFGEVDMNLQRGNPLFLSSDGYHEHYNLWLRHGLPEKIVRLLEASGNYSAQNWNVM